MSRYAKTKPRRRAARIFHLSAHLVHTVDQSTGLRTVRVARPGKTYRGSERGNEKRRWGGRGCSGRQRRIARKLERRALKRAA